MDYLLAVLLVVVAVTAWVATLFGAPGNWVTVLAAAAYAAIVPVNSPVALGWKVVAALAVLAALGEVAEFIAGALGVAREGGSRRGAALALVGSMIGAIVGVFVGLPIPVVGSILAVLLFASLGALAGAMSGERWLGRSWAESWHVGKAAFRGRLLGTVAKAVIGLVMIGLVTVALL
ncbi:MAG: DUF456 domain-containing protein [Thermoguttaceae bacterium]